MDILSDVRTGIGFFGDDWDFVYGLFLSDALKNNYSLFCESLKLSSCDRAVFEKFLKEKMKPKQRYNSYRKLLNQSIVFCDNSIINFQFSEGINCDGLLDVNILSKDESEFKKQCKLLRSSFKEHKSTNSGELRLLVAKGGTVELERIGKFDTPFEPDNYSSEVSEKFEKAVSALQDKNPFGRLLLLQGPPGTGKSYFLRNLISRIDAMHVFVPSSMVGELTGPGLVGTLLGWRANESQPIILIVEDADEAIQKRKSGNAGVLSDILNLTDGLLGELADIRIIATTNAEKVDIDEAILREGRLFDSIQFNLLTKEHCIELCKKRGFEELADKFIKRTYTLAEFYKIVGKHSTPHKKKEEKPTGNYI